MNKFKQFVNCLLESKHRMIYYDIETESVLMEGTEQSVLDIIDLKREHLENGFAFLIKPVLNDWYTIIIYNRLLNEI